MELINQFYVASKKSSLLILIIVCFILTTVIVSGAIFWLNSQKQTEIYNEIVSLQNQVDELKQVTTSTRSITETETQNPAPIPTAVSNIFTHQSQPGNQVGDMVLSKIYHPMSETTPASPDHVYAEFTNTITVTGRLSTPDENSETGGMGPKYSLNNLTQDSLAKLPYLQSDSRLVWFGIKNPDLIKNSPVNDGDTVEITINKYEYVFFPSSGWNKANIVSIKKL